MDGNNTNLLIFNGNGLEDLEQHWFLCEVLWTVRQVQDEAIKKVQMITTPRGRALDWYMKFSVISIGVTQKMIEQIQAGLIDELEIQI